MNANVIPIGITLYSRNLPEDVWVWLVCVVIVLRHFQQYFSYEVFPRNIMIRFRCKETVFDFILCIEFYLVITLATCNI
jgi:hypothetical protein